jgi:hypothetical protein
MERKLYITASALVAVAGIALAMHLLRIKDSLPATVALRGRHYSYYAYSVSRDYYVSRILLDAMFLPLLCALFGYMAHIDRQIDAASWIFVGGFYVAIWWLSWEASHAYQMNLSTPGISVGSVSDPTYMFGAGILAGLGFWKFKQDWSRESR